MYMILPHFDAICVSMSTWTHNKDSKTYEKEVCLGM